jgi:hypothetical protein
VKTTRLAALLALAPLACTHAAGAGAAGPRPPVIENPIKLMVQPSTLAPELAGVSAPMVFEQMLCNRLFDYNHKQVVCADDVRVFVDHKRQEALLSGQDVSFESLVSTMDVPRRVSLAAARSGEVIMLTIILQDASGATLGRFQKTIKLDGADVFERADEAAIEILGVK